MAESVLGLWPKLQAVFTSPNSRFPPRVPELVQLHDMVYEVYRPPHEEKPEIEIVFFHGLQLKACKEAHIKTWMSQDDSEFWPQSWLVEAFPKARILTVSYDSFAKRTNEEGRLDMFLTRENLLSELTSDSTRVGEAQCPVVLVGHCLGGLLVKELCLHANMTLSQTRDEIPGMQRIHNFFNNLRGMFFYGTPHLGSFLGEKLPDSFNGALLAEIEILNAWSARKNARFCALKDTYKWLSYGMGESHKTFVDCLGKYIQVVPEASSRANMDAYYSVQANHFNLCKPEKKQASAFSFLVNFLHEIHELHVLRSGVEGWRAEDISGRGYVVDHQGRAAKVERMLLEPNAYTTLIVGLPGIGKTTLAQQVFHDISHSFPIRCFIYLDNFEEPSKSRNEVLKKIKSALKQQVKKSSYDYLTVPLYLKGKKALIVLDNVQSQVQLDALSRDIWLEGSSSRLVVTTTDSRLGSPSNTFTVEYLEQGESRQLFHHYAFADRAIRHGLGDLIEQVIRRCGNFPLALKILGSYLSAADVNDQKLWEGIIVRLENAQEVGSRPDDELWGRLMPCYEALRDSEREMFLDAAVVFSGWPLNLVEYMWSACGRSHTVGWTNLKRNFLVSEDGQGSIQMHELLKNLGRSIACPRNSTIDRWRRISSGTLERDFVTTHQGLMETLSLELRVQDKERLTLPNTKLAQYVNLKYLILDGVEMTEGSVELPGSLVYLKWKGALFETCPVAFNGLENLAVLDLQFCKAMRILPPSVVAAKKLKWLELEGCQSLTKLPKGLYEFSDLEYLGLSMTGLKKISSKLRKLKKLRWFRADQTGLARVPDAVGRLTMLETLDISRTTVTVLPESIGSLELLTTLNARQTLLSSLPESIGDLKLLESLDAGNTLLSSLPERIGCLRNLRSLNLDRTGMKSLPESLGNVVGLRLLSLSSTPLETLPDSICLLSSLTHFHLDDTRLSTLPDAFGELKSLFELSLLGSRVRSLPETFNKLPKLKNFRFTVSTILNDGTHPSASGTHSTISHSRQDLGCDLRFYLDGTREFLGGEILEDEGEIPAMSRAFVSPTFPFYRVLRMEIVGKNLGESLLPTVFNTLKEMTSLTHLTLEWFNEVEAFPSELGTLTGLQHLTIRFCQSLRELPDSLGLLKELTELELINLPRLRRLPECLDYTKLGIYLTLYNCGSVQTMPRSFGHKSPLDRDSSPACSDESGNSDSNPTGYQRSSFTTNSWRLLRCLLECRTGQCYGYRISFRIYFIIKCEEMETVMKKAVKLKGNWEVRVKVATTVLRKLCLECETGDDGRHGIFGPSTLWPPLNPGSKTEIILCCKEHHYLHTGRRGLGCKIHGWQSVRVLDGDEEDSEGKEEDSNLEESDEDTEDEETEDSEDDSDNIEEADIEDQDNE